MYARAYGRRERDGITPPPGYVGSAFGEQTETRHHPPEDEIPNPVRDREEQPETPDPPEPDGMVLTPQQSDWNPRQTILQMIRHLDGQIGSEELLILLIMLLVASEGMSAEVLVLALVLIAG